MKYSRGRPIDLMHNRGRSIDRISVQERLIDRVNAQQRPIDRFNAQQRSLDRFQPIHHSRGIGKYRASQHACRTWDTSGRHVVASVHERARDMRPPPPPPKKRGIYVTKEAIQQLNPSAQTQPAAGASRATGVGSHFLSRAACELAVLSPDPPWWRRAISESSPVGPHNPSPKSSPLRTREGGQNKKRDKRKCEVCTQRLLGKGWVLFKVVTIPSRSSDMLGEFIHRFFPPPVEIPNRCFGVR